MKLGCDIVKIERVAQAMEKEGFLRILSEPEKQLFHALPKQRQIEWLAGRFAAKEAIIKAMSSYESLLLSQISVVYEGKRPVCNIEGYTIEISIAHEQEYAIAYAMVERSRT